MKRILKYSCLFLILSVVSTGCDELLQEINVNRNSPETATIDVVLTAAQDDLFTNFGGWNTGYWGAFTQHFAGNHATGIDMDQYNLDHSHFAWLFTGMYLGPLNDCKYVIETGTELGAWHYVGISQVMTAFSLGTMTDVYGDIPWSQALDQEIEKPAYDSQEAIYGSIQALLTEAISNLGKESSLTVGGDDLVYGGNIDQWIAAAHLLRARYHNHLSEVDPAGSASAALAAIDDAMAAGLSTAGDLQYAYEGSAQHRNRWFNLWENNLIIASEGHVNMLKDTEDPRLEAYFDSVAFPGNVVVGYEGKSNGFGISNVSFSPVGPEGYYGQAGSPQLLATYFEGLFIEAEAAMRSGDAARAAEAYNKAVEEQINKVVSDPSGVARITDYLANNASEDASSITMEKIMTQKWTAMFTIEGETWVDMRRHDFAYPAWIDLPVTQDGQVVSSDYIRRILYPQDELDKNESNVPTATVFDKLWWDK